VSLLTELAVDSFLDLKIDLSQVDRTTFPLQQFGDTLQTLSLDVHKGRGFFVLRGLNPSNFTREENVLLYLGISSYIGEKRGRQNHDGSLICKNEDLPTLISLI
jgi:hypothetical protein